MTTANKTKVTLNSIIFATAPVLRELKEGEKAIPKTEMKAFEADLADHVRITGHNLAQYFVDKSANLDVITQILTEAANQIPTVLEEVEKARQEEIAQKEKEREEEEKRRDEERKAEEKRLKEEKDKMLKILTDGGIDLEVARAAVEAAGNRMKPANTGPKNSYDRVECEIDGKSYSVPVRGNMSQELKDLAAKYKLSDDRDAFIEKFRKEPATESESKDTAEA